MKIVTVLRSLLLLICCAVPAPAMAQATLYDAFVYDAAHNIGPCPVTRDELNRILKNPSLMPSSCARQAQPVFRDSEGLDVIVLHPRFHARYSAATVTEISRGTGVLDVRGLTDITPIALSALGTPVAHGGREPSTITIGPLTSAQVLQQLLDDTQMNQLAFTLTTQATDLADASHTLELDRTELVEAIQRLNPLAPAVDCARISGAPTIPALTTCVSLLFKHVLANNRFTDGGQPAGYQRPLGCEPTGPGSPDFLWTAAEFDCVVSQMDTRTADLAVIRDRLNAYAFRASMDRVETESEQLAAKLEVLRQNLDIVDRALNDFNALKTASPSGLRELRRAELKRQFKERYGAIFDDSELNRLTELRNAPLNGTRNSFEAAFEAASKRLQNWISALRKRLPPATTAPQPQQTSQVQPPLNEPASATADSADLPRAPSLPSVDDLRREETDLRNRVTALTTGVDTLNAVFAETFIAINNVYLTRTNPEPTDVPLDLSAHAGENRDVFAQLSDSERFKPYRFDLVAATTAAPKSASTPLITAAPNPSFTVTPANLPQSEPRSFSFEMHRFWRANIVAGVVFSSIATQEFGIATNASGTTLATLTSGQRPTAHYLLGFNYYFLEHDTYPHRPRTTLEMWAPGVLGGVGLESAKHFYIGPNFEPETGVDFSFGFHYGEQQALQLGYEVGKTALSSTVTTAPTRTVMKPGFYVMVGFDLDIFRRFFGAAAPAK